MDRTNCQTLDRTHLRTSGRDSKAQVGGCEKGWIGDGKFYFVARTLGTLVEEAWRLAGRNFIL